jgi:glycerol-3-phosphate cytidylyltransferase-like family protein
VVGVHKNASHKGKTVFIPFEERCEIVKNIKYVNHVIESKPEDCDVYDDLKYNFLFVGSDYQGTPRFDRYEKFFQDKNVKIIYFSYTDGTSSTKLREVLEKVIFNNNDPSH